MDLDGVALQFFPEAIERRHQPRAGQHLRARLHEREQQSEFLGTEHHRLARAQHGVGCGVDHQIAMLDERVAATARAAQHGANIATATPLLATELGGFRVTKVERKLLKKVGNAVCDFDLIADGDLVMVCVSGGKDSYALLDLLLLLQRKSPIRYELVAVNVDQGWPGYQTETIAAHLEAQGPRDALVPAIVVVPENEPAAIEMDCVIKEPHRDRRRQLDRSLVAGGERPLERLALRLMVGDQPCEGQCVVDARAAVAGMPFAAREQRLGGRVMEKDGVGIV